MKYNWWAIKIAVATTVIFIIQLSTNYEKNNIIYEPFTDDFALVSSDILSRPWILITYIFLHGDISHLFFNMFALLLFGSVLEQIIGGRNFLILYFLSGIIAGLGSIPFYPASIGASGAIFGIIGTLGILRPMMPIYFGYAPLPMVFGIALRTLTDFAGVFSPDNRTAFIAHLVGLAFGFVFGFLIRKNYPVIKRPKRKTYPLSAKEIEEWENKYIK